MNFLHVIILGAVEGITEFLPISSTAHIEFTSHLLGILQTDFVKSFTIAIQLGAILSVVLVYFKKLFQDFKIQVWKNIIIGFIPTGIIGFILYKLIKQFLLGNVWIAAVMLILGGIVILILENKFGKKSEVSYSIRSIEDLSTIEMLKLGVIQAIAVIPGVSRSGAIIMGGMSMGIPRAVIIETAFLLAIPTMVAATGYDLLKTGIHFSRHEWLMILVGALVSALVAYGVIKWLIKFVTRSDFKVFGWYRIIAGIIFLGIFFLMS
jgi:undecaprenyl-diphosphatase